ncbi:MAG TPA: cyclic nucleotide-binding domain-containing protein, partial [Gemmatimonadaceae bacterium]|nr:cyclic nucleotide-binding domain-containing protein [Gemmatimonadaceae bacterium]
MSSHGAADQLRGIGFFEGLPDTLLWHLARVGESATYPADDLLFRQGEPRAFFTVILAGNVAIERAAGDAPPVRLATFGAGSVLGEGVLLGEGIHGSSGRATRETRV